MLYFKCPTCKTVLANKQLLYEERLQSICDEKNASPEEKDSRKRKLLDELELWRPCCRTRMMGYDNLIDKIK